MNSLALIIPAAGSGERLNRSIPKPYIKIAGRTILEHTLVRFVPIKELRQVIVATSFDYIEQTRGIMGQVFPEKISRLCVAGGNERQDSIYNALQKTADVDLVAVHDAVRPFVTKDAIEKCIDIASDVDGSVVGVPAKDTIKRVDSAQLIQETPERKFLWQTQTPQIFRKEILLEAYAKAVEDNFLGTDDSSLVERLGYDVKMVEGSRDNFKITYPIDLKLAKLLLED